MTTPSGAPSPQRWYIDCVNCGFNAEVECEVQPRDCDDCGKTGTLNAIVAGGAPSPQDEIAGHKHRWCEFLDTIDCEDCDATVADVVESQAERIRELTEVEEIAQRVVQTRITAREYDHRWDGLAVSEWQPGESSNLWSIHSFALHDLEAALLTSPSQPERKPCEKCHGTGEIFRFGGYPDPCYECLVEPESQLETPGGV